MLTAGVAGSVFASPPTASILAAIRAVARDNPGRGDMGPYVPCAHPLECCITGEVTINPSKPLAMVVDYVGPDVYEFWNFDKHPSFFCSKITLKKTKILFFFLSSSSFAPIYLLNCPKWTI